MKKTKYGAIIALSAHPIGHWLDFRGVKTTRNNNDKSTQNILTKSRRFERVEDERAASSRAADEKYVDNTKGKEYHDETYYSDSNSDDEEVGSNNN